MAKASTLYQNNVHIRFDYHIYTKIISKNYENINKNSNLKYE